MSSVLIGFGALVIGYAVFNAFKQFWRKRRSGPENEWQNEHHIAMAKEDSWSENDQSVNHSDNAPPRYL